MILILFELPRLLKSQGGTDVEMVRCQPAHPEVPSYRPRGIFMLKQIAHHHVVVDERPLRQDGYFQPEASAHHILTSRKFSISSRIRAAAHDAYAQNHCKYQ